jgi:hypothetical protein
MKKVVSILFFISSLWLSCKKDRGYQEIWFKPVSADETEMLNFDSIAYTTINYSDVPQYKTDQDFYNPDVYNHSVNLDTKKEFISIPGWNSIVIKKFDMVGKSGKIMYYMPFGKRIFPDTINKLPVSFQTQGGTKSITTMRVLRYHE